MQQPLLSQTGLRTGWVLPPEKPKSFPTNSVLVGESRLEWPSFIKHSAPADRAQRSQRVYTTAQQGPQDWTDEDARTYSFTHPHTHLLKLCRGRAFSCLFSTESNWHLWWGHCYLVLSILTTHWRHYYRKKNDTISGCCQCQVITSLSRLLHHLVDILCIAVQSWTTHFQHWTV